MNEWLRQPVLRGTLTFFRMAEYCDTPQSKERRNWEYKVCLNERAILRLLDHDVMPGVLESLGDNVWINTEDIIRERHDLRKGVRRKISMLISMTLEELWKNAR